MPIQLADPRCSSGTLRRVGSSSSTSSPISSSRVSSFCSSGPHGTLPKLAGGTSMKSMSPADKQMCESYVADTKGAPVRNHSFKKGGRFKSKSCSQSERRPLQTSHGSWPSSCLTIVESVLSALIPLEMRKLFLLRTQTAGTLDGTLCRIGVGLPKLWQRLVPSCRTPKPSDPAAQRELFQLSSSHYLICIYNPKCAWAELKPEQKETPLKCSRRGGGKGNTRMLSQATWGARSPMGNRSAPKSCVMM